ncbi:MAG: NAD(P)-dependent oxidoreductase [Alphaproteobacteria bacterium]
MAKCAFIGLGVMGYPMAGFLAGQGHDVTVYNRTTAKAQKWVGEYGGSFADTPAQAALDAEFVFICVGNDDDLRSVVLGDEGALAGIAKGGVMVDHTTASANVARELAVIADAEKGVAFVDAPISGGQVGAETGQLTTMCGGDSGAFDRAKPLMDCYSKAVTLLGEVGSGQLTKMVNQICIAGLVQALSEGVAFAQKAGLDVPTVLDVISKGAAGSWQMENRGLTMDKGEFDFGFAVDWMRKDLGIVLDEANRNGARVPVTALVDQFYAAVQAKGGNRQDTSSLIRLLTEQ